MALGNDSYKGLGLPAYGNTRMTGVSTADILTLQHSSANQGNFLVLRDAASSVFPQSTIDVNDILRISVAGNITNLGTGGAMAGFKRPVVLTTVSRVLTPEESGTLFVVSSAVGTSMTFDLPAPGTNPAGVWYEFWVTSAAATNGDVRIAATSASAAAIHGLGLVSSAAGTSIISTFAAITPLTTAALGSYWCRLTAVTSLLWAMEDNSGYSTESTLGAGQWSLGSTA